MTDIEEHYLPEEKYSLIQRDYQNYIHKSRYARWLDEYKCREDWTDTCLRYVNFWCEKYPELREQLYDEVLPAIVNKEVMPSMRAMMTAGKALDRDNVAGYNPVTGDTRVVTREFGTLPIVHLEGKSATVLNKDGKWAGATFRGYGSQPIYKVLAKLNSNTLKEVTCTANHRWIKQDGNVVATTELVPGDRIDFVSAPKPQIDFDYNLGIKHGLIYGDGTTVKSCGRVKGYVIRLCGEDNQELLKYFDNYPITYPPSANGDPVVQMYDDFAATHALKELPLPEEPDSYLLGFMRGWLAADGSVSNNSQVSLCVADDGLAWLNRNAERLGFTIQRVYKQAAETNYGKRRQGSWVVYFSRSSMVSDDFLCSWKRAKFNPLESHWVISAVEDAGYEDGVYCAEVDDTNTFVLEGGLLTGNCSYLPIEHPTAFAELMYILMCGTGVGYSVERQYVSKLPEVPEELYDTDITITVRDSKIGWVVGFKELCSLLFGGQVPRWDLSKIRPAGAVLRTFGGRASGPSPLDSLFRFTVELFKNARGRRLSSIECHDLCCKIADIVVVGGVRRSALISLSNLSDERMAKAKMGEWYKDDQAPYRALANNSVAYTERPTLTAFLREWSNLYESKAGERGIFNRAGARKRVASIGRRDPEHEWGTNPCSEIILRPYQFCNLSEVIVRPGDSLDDLRRKVRIATIVGTLQSTLTDFRVLRSIWKKNCEEERLLGVSLTGIMDHSTLNNLTRDFGPDGTRIDTLANWLDILKNLAIDTNYDWAKKLEINPATAITCVKPSGTVSQLCDTASGIHPRYAKFYIRRVTNDSKDPLCQFLIDQGVPHVDQGQKVLFEFPMESPSLAVTRNDVTAIEQLQLWMTYAKHWCEHKPSITVYVKENEWLEVAAFVWKHWDDMSGVAFLPHSDHIYENAPYEEISYEEFTKLVDNFPKLDWSAFDDYESQDNTVASQELACTGGVCEL